MTLEQIKIFIEAAHQGSFTMAAEKLGLTQSAVSMSIKKLEEAHNVMLFDRTGRRLVVTEAGQVLLRESERILRDMDLMVRRVESRRQSSGNHPIVACTPNAYDFWLPELALHIDEKKVSPPLDLICGSADEVAAWVMRGTADVGITEVTPSHPKFQHFGLFTDRIILCASSGLAASIPADIDWESLHTHAPLLWEQSNLAPVIVQALTSKGLNASQICHPSLRLTSTSAVISALQAGRFAGFVTKKAVQSALKQNALTRVGKIEIPLKYWMFGLREREIESLALQIANAAKKTSAVGKQ
jgi:DNA-binding transcriptional LysR family regulator